MTISSERFSSHRFATISRETETGANVAKSPEERDPLNAGVLTKTHSSTDNADGQSISSLTTPRPSSITLKRTTSTDNTIRTTYSSSTRAATDQSIEEPPSTTDLKIEAAKDSQNLKRVLKEEGLLPDDTGSSLSRASSEFLQRETGVFDPALLTKLFSVSDMGAESGIDGIQGDETQAKAESIAPSVTATDNESSLSTGASGTKGKKKKNKGKGKRK